MTARLVQRRERGVERRRLARVHRSAEEEQSRRAADQSLEDLLIVRRKAKLRTAEESLRGVHNAHNHALSPEYGEHRYAHIDQPLAIAITDLPVLRAVALCRVDARHYLQTRDNDGSKLWWKSDGALRQQPIHTYANPQPAVHRLEVNIRRLLRECHVEDRIHKREHRAAACPILARAVPQLTCRLHDEPLCRLPLHANRPFHRYTRFINAANITQPLTPHSPH